MELAEAFTALAQFSRESKKVPTLVLLEDNIAIPSEEINFNINIVGRKGNVKDAKVSMWIVIQQ